MAFRTQALAIGTAGYIADVDNVTELLTATVVTDNLSATVEAE